MGIRIMNILRTTTDTKFHIDEDWWKEQHRSLRLHAYDRLCPESREIYPYGNEEVVDWVDDDTAEVTRVDALWHVLRTCCSAKPQYITRETPLAEAIFRVFLANGNTPLSPLELHDILRLRPPRTILLMMTRGPVFNGLKPIFPNGSGDHA